jgi:hypothetical protein
MSQHADVVPIVAWYDRQFPLDGGMYYFSPHGFIDHYIMEAIGSYGSCRDHLEKDALVYLGFNPSLVVKIIRLVLGSDGGSRP